MTENETIQYHDMLDKFKRVVEHCRPIEEIASGTTYGDTQYSVEAVTYGINEAYDVMISLLDRLKK